MRKLGSYNGSSFDHRMKKETIRRTTDVSTEELKELLSRDTVDMNAVEAKLKQLDMMKAEMHLSQIMDIEEFKTKI